jgi:adenylate cyclase
LDFDLFKLNLIKLKIRRKRMKTIKLLLCISLLTVLATGSSFSATTLDQGQDSQGNIESSNPEAREAFSRGWEAYRLGTPPELAKAVTYLELAIALDPDYARAHSALAAAYWNIALNGWSKSLELFPSEVRELSRLSLANAKQQPSALSHQVASERAAQFRRKPDKALKEAELAIELDANDPAGHLAMAAALLKIGKAAEAVESVHTAMGIDPDFPAFYLNRLGQAEFAMGQYEKAATTLEKAAKRNPADDWTFVYLAAAYGHLGRAQEAKQALDTANALRAKVGWGTLTTQTVSDHRTDGGRRYYFYWFSDYKPLLVGLRKAGVEPEKNWSKLISSGSSGYDVEGAKTIDAETAKVLHARDVPFIDIFFFWRKKRISGAHYLDVWSYEFNDATLPGIAGKNQELVIYSSRENNGRWGPQAVARAVSWGYEKVYFFRDGIDGWKAAGYPIETSK